MIVRSRWSFAIALSAILLTTSCGRSERKTDAPSAVPLVRRTPAEVWEAMDAGIAVTGTAERASVSTTLGFQTTTKQKWVVSLQLANRTKLPLQMGRRLIVYETDSAMGIEGVAVLRGSETATNALFAGFDLGVFGVNNFDSWSPDGGRMIREGGTITFSFGGGDTNAEAAGLAFGPLAPGEVRAINLDLSQGIWIRDEHLAGARIVLPALTARTPDRDVSAVPVAYLQKSGVQQWNVARVKLYRLDPQSLCDLLAATDADTITRLLAAIWLAETFPDRTAACVLPVVATLRQGHLLNAGLQALASLRAPGAEAHAVSLLDDRLVPNGIRSSAAEYLGAIRDTGSVARLAAAAADTDKSVSSQAILSLGLIGGPAASSNLMALAGNPKSEELRKKALAQLGRVRTPDADAFLKGLVAEGRVEALQAFVDADRDDLFAYYQAALATTNVALRNVAVRGLADGPRDQSVAALMQLLEQEPAAAPATVPSPSPVVQTLLVLKPSNQVDRLVALTRAGNARAAEVLVGLSPRADADLAALAREVQDAPTLVVLLRALDRSYKPAYDAIFLDRLDHGDASVAKAAIDGLRGHPGSSDHLPRLLGVAAQDPREEVREEARAAIRTTPPGANAAALATAVLQPVRRDVAEAAATSLANANRPDPALYARVASALDSATATNAYPLIVLARSLGGGSGAPHGSRAFDQAPDKWIAQWRAWAATNTPPAAP